MKNHQQEVLEIIDGFKNLTYKIKKDNDEIRDSIKNKDETIACCKTEYQKLYAEYKDLQKNIMNWKPIFYKNKNNNDNNKNNNKNNNNNNNKSIEKYCFTLIKKGNIIWCLMMTVMKVINIQTTKKTTILNTLK